MRRLSLLLLPFLAAFALVFGVYNIYTAIRLFREHPVPAALTGLFGFVGVGLATAIWVARRRALAPQPPPPA